MPRLAFAGLLLFAVFPASAHHLGVAHTGPAKGLSIPNLSHGQMAVIAMHRSEILRLGNQTPTDPVLRRLQGYIELQTFACLWGMVPGAVDDESSPFNECSHAYLAGTRALLMHLRHLPGEHAAVRALEAGIELEMLQNRASLVLCRYSDAPFDTAEIIGPHWGEIPFHPTSCFLFGGTALLASGCFWLAVRPGRPVPANKAPESPKNREKL